MKKLMTELNFHDYLQYLLRDEVGIAYYPDELSEINDSHKLFISVEDLIENKEVITKALNEDS